MTLAALILAGMLRKMPGGFGTITSVALSSLYFVYASAGMAGLATCIGLRLTSPADSERPWRATLRGGIVLELAYLLPILGWFLILPVSIIAGSGAVSLALFKLQTYSGQAVVPSQETSVRIPTAG